MVDDDIEVPAMDIVLADQLGVIGLLYRGFQMVALADEFTADIDDRHMRIHCPARQ